jgi:hypothetical protein
VYGVKICKNIFYARVDRINDEEDIVYITEIVYGDMSFVRCAMCTASMNVQIPDKIPDDGAP